MQNLIKINDNIHRLTVSYKDIFTTVYTVQSDNGCVLFDAAATDADAENYIIPMLKEVGITAEELKYIFISHNHRDHAGGLARLCREYPNVRILSRSAAIKETYGERVISPEDNDAFLGCFSAVTVPGHTLDCCTLIDNRTKTYITGDCLQLYGIFGSEDWAANIPLPTEYFKALEKLRGLDIAELLMAHDYHPIGYRACGREEVYRTIDSCREPLLKVKQLILENPQLDDAAIRSAYNSSGKIPTIRERIVAAVRAAVQEGNI